MNATFQIKDSFQITGRGLVAIGDILSGTIRVGDVVDIDINDVHHRLRITGVEMGDRISTKEYFVGLSLRSDSGFDLTGVKLKSQAVEIFRG